MPIDRADRMLDDDDDDDDDRLLLCPRLCLRRCLCLLLHLLPCVSLSLFQPFMAPRRVAPWPEIGSFVFSGSFYDLGPICFTSHLTLEPATSARLVSFLTSHFWHKF